MFHDKISDYFEGVAAKYLSAVDARPERSNQHEIGGLPSAGFKEYLGTPNKDEKFSFPARMVYLTDEGNEPVISEDPVTWYDVRWKNPDRRPEYRLYYKSNDVTRLLSAGDFCLIGKLHEGKLLVVFAPAGSTAEAQLRNIFGITHVTDDFTSANLDSTSILLPLRLVLEDLGLAFSKEEPDDESWLDEILKRFGNTGFPLTADFSNFARDTYQSETVDTLSAPDAVLLGWMNHEEKLFRILERHTVRDQLQQGFGPNGDDVDAFVSYSLSVQNRRKSRVGRAFENHLAKIFTVHNLKFEQGGGKRVTENNSKPDFIFPGFDAYSNPGFPAANLRLLGAKTTCKDRWRQVLSEGVRVPCKHLVTLEAAISESQTNEMKASNLQLVVPAGIHPTYSPLQQRWLLSIGDFIADVKSLHNGT